MKKMIVYSTDMGAPKGFSLRRSWHKSALRNRFVTDVV